MKKVFIFIFLLIVVMVLSFVTYKGTFVSYFDTKIYNTLKFKNQNTNLNSVIIVKIDEKSLEIFGQWPWNRILIAKLMQDILLSKPAALGIDIVFAEKDRTSLKKIKEFYKEALGYEIDTKQIPKNLQDSDQILASSLLAGKSVLAMFAEKGTYIDSCKKVTTIPAKDNFKHLDRVDNVFCSYELINKSSNANGFINANPSDGILKSTNSFLYYKNDLIPSLTMAMLMKVDPNLNLKKDENNRGLVVNFLDKKIKLNENSEAINEIYPQNKFMSISAADILLGNANLDQLSGKFVLFGATAMGLYDKFIDIDGNVNPGIYYHASFLENFLSNKLISQPNYYKKINFYISVLALMVLTFVMIWYGYLYAILIFLFLIIIAIIYGYAGLKDNVYLSVGYFLIPLSLIFLNLSLISACLNFLENRVFLKEIDKAHSATIESMITVIERKDLETGGHIVRTREYVKILALYLYRKGLFKDVLNLKFIEILTEAVPLHDIGKVAIPDKILSKEGSLNEDEWEIMKQHVEHGRDIIQKAKTVSDNKNIFLNAASNIVYTHHEKWDGSGYPQGLKGEEIPLEGRLMALADVYDALTSKRSYKDKLSFEDTERYILENSGTHFDPRIVEAFIKLKDEFRKICNRSGN